MKNSRERNETEDMGSGPPVLLPELIRAALYLREDILQCALAGDWAPLAEYIRRGGRITPRMRPFLVDVLNGRRIRPRVKISRWATKLRNGEVVSFIRMARLRGEAEKNYSEAAEKKFGRTWRHLQKILAKEIAGDAELANAEIVGDAELTAFFKDAETLLQTAYTEGGVVYKPGAIPQSRIRPDGSVIRYRLSDTALSPHTLA